MAVDAIPRYPAAGLIRTSSSDILRKRSEFLVQDLLVQMTEAMPAPVVILDAYRQIIAANSTFMANFNIKSIDAILGLRPGEAIRCRHHVDGPDGCGTGDHCTACGAAATMVAAASGGSSTGECHLAGDTETGSVVELEVKATPLKIGDLNLSVCAFTDISAQKRKDVLERVFFHDVLNTAGGIRGLASVLASKKLSEGEEADFKKWILEMTDKLIAEIDYQRHLVAAERGEFHPRMEPVSVREIMHDIYALYVNHDVAEGRNLRLADVSDVTIITDNAVLRRILGNLVKNALEATPRKGTVTVSCRDSMSEICFTIHNPGEIPHEVQLQLFERSFSTKAPTGRGIGTYSVKLFSEKYLNGKVYFESTKKNGTSFSVCLPKY